MLCFTVASQWLIIIQLGGKGQLIHCKEPVGEPPSPEDER